MEKTTRLRIARYHYPDKTIKEKCCRVCKCVLPISKFLKHTEHTDGYRNECSSCTYKLHVEWTHRTGRKREYTNFKGCSVNTGVFIAEGLLSKMFNNVIQMPMGNKGYDFTVNGFKVDVKSSTAHYNHIGVANWKFNIKKNKCPDYFALLALDNRESLTALHL